MTIEYRYYETPSDITLQYEFWNNITSQLPYCWKATTSPTQFLENPKFHPKSRCFAFDNKELVGYMSFTGSGTFVSLGYPWVKAGYEGEVQDELWNRVFGFAKEDYGGKQFLQRFRKQWDKQIKYFEEKGLQIHKVDPIYQTDVNLKSFSHEEKIQIEDFDFQKFASILNKDNRYTSEQIEGSKSYFDSVQFDFAASSNTTRYDDYYMGLTHRKDTGYSEFIAFVVGHSRNNFPNFIQKVIFELYQRKAKILGITTSEDDDKIDLYTANGFSQQSGDVYLGINF